MNVTSLRHKNADGKRLFSFKFKLVSIVPECVSCVCMETSCPFEKEEVYDVISRAISKVVQIVRHDDELFVLHLLLRSFLILEDNIQ